MVASNGKSIEISNTDAEGRLILADALVYSTSFNPHTVIDVATLTGGVGNHTLSIHIHIHPYLFSIYLCLSIVSIIFIYNEVLMAFYLSLLYCCTKVLHWEARLAVVLLVLINYGQKYNRLDPKQTNECGGCP